MFGQEPIDINPDGRGVIPREEAAQIRDLRAQEQWERFDSVAIGSGAAAQSRGWYDTWGGPAGLGQADQLQWFAGRDPGVGPAYTNQFSERSDWAQDIYQVTCQFIAPPGISDLETDQNDALNMPVMFAQMLPPLLSLKVILADSDEIARAPADHFPAGIGTAYSFMSGNSSPVTVPGTNGEPAVAQAWYFPEPVMLAAKSQIRIVGQIDNPIRGMFQNVTGPGSKLIPIDDQGGVYEMPNFYVIKITLRGPRYLQLRGARSSA